MFCIADWHLCPSSVMRCPAVTFVTFPLLHFRYIPSWRPMFRFADSVVRPTRFAANSVVCSAVTTVGRKFLGCYLHPRPESSAACWHGSGAPGRALAGSSVQPPRCRATKQIRNGAGRNGTMRKSSQTGLARIARRTKGKRCLHHCRRRCSRVHSRRWRRWKGTIVALSTV